MRARSTWALLALALTLLGTSCSSSNKVGNADLLNVKGGSGRAGIGDPASPTPKPTRATAVATKTPVAPKTSAPVHQPTAKPKPTGPQIALTIAINSDTGGKSQFDPSYARIYTGTCVRWTNADKINRSIVGDAGFTSGPLAPGAGWTYCPPAAGKFNYHDGTRPYAVATLEVLKR